MREKWVLKKKRKANNVMLWTLHAVHLPVLYCFDTLSDNTAIKLLHVLIHFREVVHQISFRATVRHGGEFERGFVGRRVHQLEPMSDRRR